MVLKSLILQGFKSFPDRTEIKFLGGMTAIVGPNGSGKSNISDAIRWVLGEQSSRSLRGAKMEDVIFGGTAKRGPVGFAEVSLILDNSAGIFRSPFAEIMVTRRYYRSGESEYSLGKKHCRLRDIRELFMDTGLGLDGYSSIGQGRIDEILSLRSEDRRGVFEEAAGITKFRARKEEAERRLAATEDNLTRIRDLYDELGRQLEPLEKQAKKTEKFLVLRDELRVLEVSLWLEQLERLKSEAEKRSRDAEVCRRQLENAKSEQERRYQQAEQLTADLHGIDRETEALRTSLREAESREAGQASRIAVLRANLANCRANLERVHRENEERAKQAEKLAEQFSAQETRIAELEQSSAEARERLAAKEDRLAQHREAEGAAAAALERAEQARAAADEAALQAADAKAALEQQQAALADTQTSLEAALLDANSTLTAQQAAAQAQAAVTDAAKKAYENATAALDAYVREQSRRYTTADLHLTSLDFRCPLDSYGRITTQFAEPDPWGIPHRGTDFAAPGGTPIYAIADGVVSAARTMNSYGNCVQVSHGTADDGHRYDSLYAHMSSIAVAQGAAVQKGDLLGYVGNTGNVYGAGGGYHLHLELRVDGSRVDPLGFVPTH